MDFRKKHELNQKMKVLYDELYNPHPKQKKNKVLTGVLRKAENSEKFKSLNNLLNAPYKGEKSRRTILTLIEETKRDYLNYKSFLDIDNGILIDHNKFKSDSNLKGVNKGISFKFNKPQKLNNPYDIMNQTMKNSRHLKNENLKKEIMTELNNKWENSSTNYSTINKSYRETSDTIL